MLQGHPRAGAQGAQVLGEGGTGTGTGRRAGPGWMFLTGCLPTQSPAELENKIAAFLDQKAERAGKGAGYQVGATALPRGTNVVGWRCHQQRFVDLLPFGSLSSGEEEEGREEEEKKMSPKATADEAGKEEEEEVELALAEMKAKELAELKR